MDFNCVHSTYQELYGVKEGRVRGITITKDLLKKSYGSYDFYISIDLKTTNELNFITLGVG